MLNLVLHDPDLAAGVLDCAIERGRWTDNPRPKVRREETLESGDRRASRYQRSYFWW